MSVQGLDRAAAPSAATAKRMLAEIGGRWWNVYIGGPESGGSGWTPALVKDYVRHGIDRFMLTYVGRQSRGPLTSKQGKADGLDALAIAKKFGYSGHFPLCLDVELPTFESAPAATVEYARAWCATVRAAGARPGVYANAAPLKAMAAGGVRAEFVWVASWVSHGPAEHGPHAIPNLPAKLWAKPGGRAWQYAGAFDGKPCRVLGLDVDISVADLGCLAKAPGHQHVTATKRPAALRRGDEGPRVERLTRRLSFVRSRVTGAPYLDRARRHFDRETEAALRAFQRDHGLDDTGRLGKRSRTALRAAVAKQKRQDHGAAAPAQNGAKPPVTSAHKELADLARRARRTDQRQDAALADLLAYGLKRKRLLQRLQHQRANSTEGLLAEVVKLLREIGSDVDVLRQGTDHEQVHAEPVAVYATAAPAPPSHPPQEPNGKPPAATALAELPERAIAQLIQERDASIDAARGVLVERFKGYDTAIARLLPRGVNGGGGNGHVTVKPSPHNNGHSNATPVKPKPGASGGHGKPRDAIRLGDEAHLIRASKLALARFLAAKGGPEHVKLKRALKRDARGRQGEVATRTWETGVRAAQHLTGLRVTGVMDGRLQQRLQPSWPTDSAVRRFLRGTPAWRLIKGQVSPNFNLREFACKDGTPYVAGLIREQGLPSDQAQRRARELAKRLERVRKAGGDRRLILNSVYRTIAHNAKTPGASTKSAHLRGFAADIQPPSGVSLETHRKHVRAAFESGVGFYSHGNFVHGDFDPVLGKREWVGP
jgi:hypothetical protein